MDRNKLVAFLDNNFEDLGDNDAPNGLQFLGKADVKKVALAVDARLETIERAIAMGADMLFTHHLMIFKPITHIGAVEKARLAPLFVSGLNVYGQHLPLDKHPVWGNNVQIAKALGIDATDDFALYHGFPIGVCGKSKLSFDDLVEKVNDKIGKCQVIKTHEDSGRVCIVSGGGRRASMELLPGDTFITGDYAREVEIAALEKGFNVIFAGHYNTETFGVKAVGKELKKMGLATEFIDCRTLS